MNMAGLLEESAKRGLVPSKEFILTHAVPLVSSSLEDDSDRIDGHASAFFLSVGECSFLITAAHVVDDSNSVAIFAFVPEPVAFEWDGIAITEAKNGNRDNDRFDIAVLKLKPDAIRAIKDGGQYKFFTTSELNCFSPKGPSTLFTIAGFPHSKYQYDNVRLKFKPELFTYLGKNVSAKEYEKEGVGPLSSIVVRYNRSKAANDAGPIKKLFHPRSMSGGPVFYRNKLCGVFIEYKEKYARAVATRIEVVVEMIRHRWPELSEDLPRTQVKLKEQS